MTVSTTHTRSGPYAGNGASTTFPVDFEFFEYGDLLVIERSAAGVETIKTLDVDYTVAGGSGETGEVIANVAPPPGVSWTVVRRSARTQTTAFVDADALPARSLEGGFDRAVMIAQEADARAGRALRLPDTDGPLETTLPPAPQRAGRMLGFDADGNVHAVVYLDPIPENIGAQPASAALSALAGLPLATNDLALSLLGKTTPEEISDLLSMLRRDGDASKTMVRALGSVRDRRLEERFAEELHLMDYMLGPEVVIDNAWDRMYAVAPATGAKVVFPAGDWTATKKLTWIDKDLCLQAAGMGVTRVIFSGVTGGIEFTDNTNSANVYKVLSVRDVTLVSNTTGVTALRGWWRPYPFAFNHLADIQNVDVRIVDIGVALPWAVGIHLTNVTFSGLSSVSVTNQINAPTGTGILLDGFALGNAINDVRTLYCASGIRAEATPLAIINFTGQTANFHPGSVLTSSGGAKGVIVSVPSDSGASGQVWVLPINGVWAVGHTMADDAGGNGAISAVDTSRTYCGEGYYLSHIEAVGCQRGIYFSAGTETAKQFTGIHLTDVHSNSTLSSVDIRYAVQAYLNHCNLYALGDNCDIVSLTGVRTVNVADTTFDRAGPFAGVTGVKVRPAASSNQASESRDISIDRNRFNALATGVDLGAETYYAKVRDNAFSGCAVDITSVRGQVPLTPDGVWRSGNHLSSGLLDPTYLSSGSGVVRSDTSIGQFFLWNGSRKWSLAVNGAGNSPAGGLAFTDETAALVRASIDANGAFSVNGATYLKDSLFDAGRIEVGINGSGDRNAYIDLHASGAAGAADYSARLFRAAGANGALSITNTGSGAIALNPAAGAALTVNVGTTASAANAYIDATTGSLLRSTSSERYKADLEPISLDIVRSAGPAILDAMIWYRSTAPSDNPTWSWYGLSAERLAEIDPRLVHWTYPEDAYEDVVVETYQTTELVVEEVEEVEAEVVVEGDVAVVRPVTRTVKRPVIDTYPLVQPDGTPVLDDDGKPRMHGVPRTRIATHTQTERRPRADARMIPDGVQYERVWLLAVLYLQDRISSV